MAANGVACGALNCTQVPPLLQYEYECRRRFDLKYLKNRKIYEVTLVVSCSSCDGWRYMCDGWPVVLLSLIHISEPRDRTRSRMPSSA